eukprot:TRINITY_DN112648_c0_g1_i1.p1 TRINITY_DN112648_c0_g1~~TRINITY_DN112648_c0_g1_i1.p1  ORF type:complete len:1463 (+),score=386.76 TRINITY_DN112648_c0_g1_i1:123-4511(+)
MVPPPGGQRVKQHGAGVSPAVQARAQAHSLATATAAARQASGILKTAAHELTVALSQGATALAEWRRIAFQLAEGGAPAADVDASSWAQAVRGMQTLEANVAALQAEAADAAGKVATIAGAQLDLETEMQDWVLGLPKEAACPGALQVLHERAGVRPLGGEGTLLREVKERHPAATLLSAISTSEAVPLPAIVKRSPSASSARSATVTPTSGGLKSRQGEERPTYACTAARKAGERAFALQSSGLGKPGKMGRSLSSSFFSSQSTLRRSSFRFAEDTDTGSAGKDMAELIATQMALSETKAELAVLRSRARDKAPPVTVRLGGPEKPGIPFTPIKRNSGADGAESLLQCSKMRVPPKAGDSGGMMSRVEDEMEIARLRYQVEDLERDLTRAQRFLTKGREEIAEVTVAVQQAREQEKTAKQELEELRATALKKVPIPDLTKEVQERGLDVQVQLLEAIASKELAAQLKSVSFDVSRLQVPEPKKEEPPPEPAKEEPPPLPPAPPPLPPPRSEKPRARQRSLPGAPGAIEEEAEEEEYFDEFYDEPDEEFFKMTAPARGRTRSGKVLWKRAKLKIGQLVKFGGEKAQVELQLSKVYDKFREDFQDERVGMLEFISKHASQAEFNEQVRELIDSDSTAASKEASTTAGLAALEAEMAAGYNAAFKKAGGNKVAEPFFPEANRLLRQLRLKRGTKRFRQDAGFDILGLDAVYDTVARCDAKLGEEMTRIAEATGGHLYHAKLKGRVRARAKVLTKYGNNPAYLTDLMRASIVYPSIEALYDALFYMLHEEVEHGRRDYGLLEVTDRFQEPKDGYRDVSMLVEVDGVVGEVQLHLQHIKDSKSGTGHDAYKKQRMVNETLFEACVRASVPDIVALAKEYKCCAAGVKDKYGRTALHYACQVGSFVAVRLLVMYGADVWATDVNDILPFEVALRAACGSENKLHTKQIVSACKICGDAVTKPWVLCGGKACKVKPTAVIGIGDSASDVPSEHDDVVQCMLAAMLKTKNGQINPRGPKHIVEVLMPWWTDHVLHLPEDCSESLRDRWLFVGSQMVRIVIDFKAHATLHDYMLDAAANADFERVKLLLDVGFDEQPQRGEQSVMDVLIENGHTAMAARILALPHPKHRPKGYNATACNCSTVHLHLRNAAKQENVDYMKTALAAKADPNHAEACLVQQRSPLMCFAAGGHLDACRLLVENDAQVNMRDKFSCSASQYAEALGEQEVVAYLNSVKEATVLPKKDDATLEYLLEAVRAGCAGAVARFVNAHKEAGTDAIELLNKNDGPYKLTPLHSAVQAAKKFDQVGQCVRALIYHKADPTMTTSAGDTVLHYAAAIPMLYQYVREAVIRYLEDGGGVDVCLEDLESQENEGGQEPRDVLKRSMTREQMQRAGLEEPPEESEKLKRFGFLGFRINAQLKHFKSLQMTSAEGWLDLMKDNDPAALNKQLAKAKARNRKKKAAGDGERRAFR